MSLHLIAKATDAALNLLEALYDETGDWLLAIAAYNVGIRRIHQAASNNKNVKAGFWGLPLPGETREFVARLLALSKVVYESQPHGLMLPVLEYKAVHY